MALLLESRNDFTLEAYRSVAWEGQAVAFAPAALARMAECRMAFERLIADPDVTIYGVTSGYGQHARIRLMPEERRSHAARPPYAPMSSFGEPLPERLTRGIVFARLVNFVEGHAAVTPTLAQSVAAMLDGRPLPPVPSLGQGGAGEILALSHLFAPLADDRSMKEKESLALINGSPCATAMLADAALLASQRIALATEVFALAWEALQAPLEHLDPVLETYWGDRHEMEALRSLREALDGVPTDGRRPYQAPVSWRILPRVLGQAHRALDQARQAAVTALRAITDNPVFVPPDEQHPNGRVLSTGGYHNAAASPALDALAAAWADLALLCDRQVSKLLDGKVSLLPDQLVSAPAGYLGCLGFTAAGFAEQAREAVRPSLLPGSEGGGFGQNDVSLPTFRAWRREAEAARCFEAAMAVLAVIASQALAITERPAPPRLAGLLEEVREAVPPVRDRARPVGREVEVLWHRFGRRSGAVAAAGIAETLRGA